MAIKFCLHVHILIIIFVQMKEFFGLLFYVFVNDIYFLDSASPQMISMLGNSYPMAGGQLSQSHVQTVNNLSAMEMLGDVNSNGSPFDFNDFPQLSGRPGSAGGPQGQLGKFGTIYLFVCLLR